MPKNLSEAQKRELVLTGIAFVWCMATDDVPGAEALIAGRTAAELVVMLGGAAGMASTAVRQWCVVEGIGLEDYLDRWQRNAVRAVYPDDDDAA